MFKRILPDSVTDKNFAGKQSHGGNQSFELATYRSQVTRRSTIKTMTGRSARHTEDNESNKAILEDPDEEDSGQKFSGIMRTIRVGLRLLSGSRSCHVDDIEHKDFQ